MTRRLLTALAICAVLAAGFVFLSRPHRASVTLPDGETVTLNLRAMFGIHSDWHRWLIARTPDAGRVRVDLFEDTGWWRGSNLYRRPDGALVLDEGQAGCVLLPPESGPSGCPDREGWSYLGRFGEAGRDRRNRAFFTSADTAPEIALPDAF